MMLKIYALKDELNGYTTGIPFPNEDIAKRYFKEQKELNPTIKLSTNDFSLWKLGEFDTETGETLNDVKLIERG